MLFVNLLFTFPYCIDKLINNERHDDMTIEVINNISFLVNYQPHIGQLHIFYCCEEATCTDVTMFVTCNYHKNLTGLVIN